MPRSTENSSLARPRRRIGFAGAALLLALGGVTVIAAQFGNSSATVSRPAVRVDRGLGDVAVVSDTQDLEQGVAVATFSAAEQAGAAAAPARTASVGMRALYRGNSVVHAPPAGWLIPIVYLAMPRAALGGVIGDDIPGGLDAGTVMMNDLTAQTIGAQVGDVLELRAVDDSSQWFTIGRI